MGFTLSVAQEVTTVLLTTLSSKMNRRSCSERAGGANKVHEKREAKGRAFRVQAMKEKRTEITLRFGRRHIDDTLPRGLSPQGGGPFVRIKTGHGCRIHCNHL